MPTRIVQNVQYLHPRELPTPYSARAVQATAYALLLYMRKDLFEDAQPIMRWLQTQRDTPSGFVALQVSLATVLAIDKCSVLSKSVKT